jgi:hypothetical protein
MKYNVKMYLAACKYNVQQNPLIKSKIEYFFTFLN